MRGVAAMSVVFYHCWPLFGVALMPSGYLAVDLFFAISGYVIAHAYDDRLAAGLTTVRFVALRVVRFWPLYALGMLLGLIAATGSIPPDVPHMPNTRDALLTLVLALGFLPTAWGSTSGYLFPYNIPSWSLLVELLVNVGYAAAFPRLGQRLLPVVAAGAAAALVLLTLDKGDANFGAELRTLPGGLARALFSFPIGALLFRSGWRRWRLPTPVLLAAVFLLLALPVPPAARAIYDLTFILVASPLLVAIGAASAPSPNIRRVCATLGIVSFPVYAIHRPLLVLAQPLARHFHAPELIGLTLILMLVPGALMLDRYVDRPLRKWLTTLAGIRPEGPLPEATLP